MTQTLSNTSLYFPTGLLKGVKSRHRIALMCAETDPLTCHRAILGEHLNLALSINTQEKSEIK